MKIIGYGFQNTSISQKLKAKLHFFFSVPLNSSYGLWQHSIEFREYGFVCDNWFNALELAYFQSKYGCEANAVMILW
jgi:hypothetical protein